jgi:DNA polymerase-3 subunit delta
VKLAANRVEAFLKAPDVPAVLIYGPDAGLVRERLDRLAKSVSPDLSDPFRVADLTMPMLKEDPARLSDEIAALSMMGGRRVVRVRDASDALAGPLRSWLDHPLGDALLLIEAGDLTPRSALRKLAESEAKLAALACYADEGGSLQAVIADGLRSHGLTAEPDAVGWLADHLGGDRLLTRSELEKLALYMGDSRRVTLEDASAVTGDTAAFSQDDLAMAASEGDQATAQRVLDRLLREGVSPITLLRGLQRHFTRLHLVAGLVADGKSVDQAVAALRPPLHFRVAGRMKSQLPRWPAEKLATALEVLLTAEIDCKTTGLPAPEICGRAVLQLARAAAAGSNRGSR